MIAVVMGSRTDWKEMKYAIDKLREFEIEYETKVVSAHRTPDFMFTYADSARSRGIRVIIAGAGGSAHLPGMLASKTTLPVLGVPIGSSFANGLPALYSIAQMPTGVPVATFGVNNVINAALYAIRILALTDAKLAKKLDNYIAKQTELALAMNPGD